jgi:hypothetical protein
MKDLLEVVGLGFLSVILVLISIGATCLIFYGLLSVA